MGTYVHVIDEMEDAPNQDAEEAIRAARAWCARASIGHSG
jgi:hypothetical protein